MPSAYCTVDEGDTYFTTLRLNGDAWVNSTTAEKQIALYQSTRALEQLRYAGMKKIHSQELEFPRWGQTLIPENVKYACLENALALLDGVDPEIEQELLREATSRFSSVGVTYDPGIADEAKRHGIASYTAWQLIRPYLLPVSSIRIRRV